MADPRLLLELFGEPPAQPVDLIGAEGELPELPWLQQEQPVQVPQNLSQRIQEALGAKEPNQGGQIQDILSARFNDGGVGPSYGDYAQGVVQSALGKPSVGASTMGDRLKQIAELEKLSAQTDLYRAGGSGNATIKAAQTIMQENPGMTFSQAFSFAKSGLGQGITYENGQVVAMPGAPGAIGAIAGGKTTGAKTAEQNVERQAGYTKAQGALRGFEQQTRLVTDTIDKALATISPWSTGYGTFLTGLPNTEARKLNNYLNTIKGNIGFDKLQQMRENSPTGGALGQVSDFENKLLQAVNGALDPAQSDQLAENLKTIKVLYPQVLQERRRAFQQDFGGYEPLGGNPQPQEPLDNTVDPLGIRQ